MYRKDIHYTNNADQLLDVFIEAHPFVTLSTLLLQLCPCVPQPEREQGYAYQNFWGEEMRDDRKGTLIRRRLGTIRQAAANGDMSGIPSLYPSIFVSNQNGRNDHME